MKNTIEHLIHDFRERPLPPLKNRDIQIRILKGKASTLTGVRRGGKTSVCLHYLQSLLNEGIPRERALYLNFEDERLLEFRVQDFQTILDVFYAANPDNKDRLCYFFFDEIQVIPNWERFIRRLIDTENVQIFITGSSSKMLSTEIATSLRGRSLTTEVFPLSFREFLTFNTIKKTIPNTFGSRNAAILRKAVKEYLEIGGFPEVQNIGKQDRIEILQGYVESVIFKDVVERHNVKNIKALKLLIKHIMNTPGGLFSVTKFHNTLKSMGIKCSREHLYNFIDYLEDAFLFFRAPIHSRSEKARSNQPNKIYTVDTGLLQAMTFRNSSNTGLLLENMLFLHLRREGWQIEYVRTAKGYETDFLARHKLTGDVRLIQVCWDLSDENTFTREVRGLRETMKEFGIDCGTIVTWNDGQDVGNGISVIPAWKWLVSEA